MIKKLLFGISALMFINIITIIITSKFNIGIGTWLYILVLIATILYAIFFDKFPRKYHILIGATVSIPLIFSTFLAIYGNRSTVNFNEDVLIVLGAGVIGEEVTPSLASRLDTAADYFNQNPNTMIIVSGGMGDNADITEAEAMKRYLIEKGIPPERIIKEDESTSTYENFAFTRQILETEFPADTTIAFTTNTFHIYRAAYIARHFELNVNQLDAPTPLTAATPNYLREMLAVINTKLFQAN